jgi:hypothetical protein
MNEWLNGRYLEGKCRSLLQVLSKRKTTKNLIHGNRCSSRDSTTGHPEYECRTLLETNMKMINIVTCVTIDGVWIGDSIYWPHDSELQIISAPPLISTIHKSPQHPLSFFQPAVSSPVVPWQRLLTVEILQLHELKSSLHRLPYGTELARPNCLPYKLSALAE